MADLGTTVFYVIFVLLFCSGFAMHLIRVRRRRANLENMGVVGGNGGNIGYVQSSGNIGLVRGDVEQPVQANAVMVQHDHIPVAMASVSHTPHGSAQPGGDW
jgi:hypothetical protein